MNYPTEVLYRSPNSTLTDENMNTALGSMVDIYFDLRTDEDRSRRATMTPDLMGIVVAVDPNKGPKLEDMVLMIGAVGNIGLTCLANQYAPVAAGRAFDHARSVKNGNDNQPLENEAWVIDRRMDNNPGGLGRASSASARNIHAGLMSNSCKPHIDRKLVSDFVDQLSSQMGLDDLPLLDGPILNEKETSENRQWLEGQIIMPEKFLHKSKRQTYGFVLNQIQRLATLPRSASL